jgi:hypothetical protein
MRYKGRRKRSRRKRRRKLDKYRSNEELQHKTNMKTSS